MGDLEDGNPNREERRKLYAVWHRTTLFDPKTEIPCLETWFQDNPNPNYELVVQYTNFLNKQPFRTAPTLQLVPEIVRVWFMYQRANSDSEEDIPNRVQRTAVCRRTYFDPETEIPHLEMWFQDNPNPEYEVVVQYTDLLNKQPFRISPNPQLVPDNIKNWFKNQRAKKKRDKQLVWFKYQHANSDSKDLKEDNPNREQGRVEVVTVCRRTLFDPQTEIPHLEMWFQENQYPKYKLIVQYTIFLNKQPSRSSPIPQLVPENIKNWFMNRRKKEKRDKKQ